MGRYFRKMASFMVASLAFIVLSAQAIPNVEASQSEDPTRDGQWWTLTDDISPAELQRRFESPEAAQERFRQAVEIGLRDPMPEEHIRMIRTFLHGELEPEIVPMWFAVHIFSSRLYSEGDPRGYERKYARELQRLEKYEISREQAETILEYTTRQLDESHAINLRLTPTVQEFIGLVRAVQDQGDERAVKISLKQLDPTVIADATGRRPSEVASMMEAWQRDAGREVASYILPELKEQLSKRDWERLRRFLFLEVASNIAAIDFER